jgi:hypothetical protein
MHAAEMLGKIIQRTLITGFIPLYHARPNEREHLHGNRQSGGVSSLLEIESRERDGEALAIHVEGFA